MSAEPRRRVADPDQVKASVAHVQELLRTGASKKAAFEAVAQQEGTTWGAIQQRYYVATKADRANGDRQARDLIAQSRAFPADRDPTKAGRAGAKRKPDQPTGSVADLLAQAAELTRQASVLVRELERDAQRWRQLRASLDE